MKERLFIFPEGTTSNGIGLLNFKKGAFIYDCPLKVMSIKYISKISYAYSGLDPLDCLIMKLCNFFCFV